MRRKVSGRSSTRNLRRYKTDLYNDPLFDFAESIAL
jgi:hypothetical protein